MKRIWCLLLSLCLCAALCVPALAWPQNYAECWDYVSWVRDGSLDERNNPFEADKKITMLGWDIENEVPTSNEENYEYVASDTSWTVKNTGTGNYYIWISCGHCPRMENGSYSGEWGASLRENGSFVDEAMDDEEEGYKVKQLYPGESVTFSFNQFIEKGFVDDSDTPAILDKGDGQYLYTLRINMEFPDENDAWARLSKNFMFNEAEAGGGQTPGGATIVQQGTCGDNLTWTLDDMGTLTISGTGDMSSYSHTDGIYPPWYRANIKTLNIQSGVTSIGSLAFYACSGLTSVTIPDSVTKIENQAFVGCYSMTSVTIPNSVTSIGSGAFQSCSGLTSVTIPDSVTSIGNRAFQNCFGLTSVTISGNVASISEATFQSCSGLTSVTIPDGVTSIEMHAFSYCSALTSVIIPASIINIGNGAFSYCSSLLSITIPDRVTIIDKNAFSSCSGLASITIPASVTSIDFSAFADCSGLTDVYYGGTETQWKAVTIKWNNDAITNAQIHYGGGSEPTSAYSFPSAPTASGGASITRANVGTLTQITVPVAYSGDTAQTVTFAVPFYDGSGKFIGVGMKTETVTSSTQSVTVPVSGLSGSESMKVIILGDNFDPLSPAGSYNIPA